MTQPTDIAKAISNKHHPADVDVGCAGRTLPLSIRSGLFNQTLRVSGQMFN
ncbi:hypothetical protein QUA40_21535 [Microcoleus sp. Pol11C3]|uniref:hypothetical protein n=1 Tax=Microcoleus sp. Pol11C3 TaxID=3055390 RepID=UPI002FD17B1B